MTAKETQGIWVLAEIKDTRIQESTFELLAKAQELKSKTNEDVTAILLEQPSDRHEDQLIGYGADRVIVVKSDLFSFFDPVLYRDAIVELARRHQPSIFLLAASFQGRSLAPRIQGALQTGLTADCLDLSIDEQGHLVQIKPSYGDNVMCTILIPAAYPQMTTVRPGVFKALPYQADRRGEIIVEALNLSRRFTFERIGKTAVSIKPNSIKDAKRIVAFGRGIKNRADCVHLEQLAEQLNAKIGVTRPLAENGWYSVNEQIGQSGVTIEPDLILNFGIAGAVQYTIGMKDSKFVFSVNKDERASIFRESDYGYVGDAKAFAIELSKQLEATVRRDNAGEYES